MKGKTIRIYLVDGVPTGVLTAEIINWTGKIIVCPRSQLAELGARNEARRAGVYFLVGADPRQPSKELVYVGEGENVLRRLVYHDKDEKKDFWSRTLLVISKDENLTKSHVRFLESRLIQMVTAAGRANLTNDTAPEPSSLPEPDVADMEFFLQQVQMVLPVLGFNFTQPRPTVTDVMGDDGASPIFELSVGGAQARARQIGDHFIVLRDSTARRHGVDSWTSYRSLRDQLVEEGRLGGTDPQTYVFLEDVAFSSPSAGAAVVAGRNMNGRQSWRAQGDGRTYEDWYQEKLRRAGLAATAASDVGSIPPAEAMDD